MSIRHTLGLVPVLFAAIVIAPAADAPAPVAEEKQQIEERQVNVWARKEISINARGSDEADVASRELWYASFDGKAWGEWQKHGIVFQKEQPISWAPNEGHWKLYFRKTLIAGLAAPVPEAGTKGHAEFIIDRTAPTGAIEFPTSKAKLRGGSKYTIKWQAADKYLKASPITIRYSRDGKGTWDVVAQDIPNTGSYEWMVPKDMTTAGQLQVLIADKAGNVGTVESLSVLVDSVNPGGMVTGPAISAKLDTTLDTEVRDVGPAGLSAARLWISQDDGASWAEGPFLTEPFKSVSWKATTDGKYRLAIVATDQSGNISVTPKGKAEDQFLFIVDTTAPAITLSSAQGIVEADKAVAGRRAFKPGDRVAVPFAIKDANLTPNSVTVLLQTDGKAWKELGKGLPTDSAFRFEIPSIATKTAKIKVTAVDNAGNLGEVVSVEGFEIQTTIEADVIDIK
ncbi:MAG: Ig-like domain repeat protein [Planctomycetes bacterium]|nr:Ig-like domain repeat protein [Planctomycetota bacterium]